MDDQHDSRQIRRLRRYLGQQRRLEAVVRDAFQTKLATTIVENATRAASQRREPTVTVPVRELRELTASMLGVVRLLDDRTAAGIAAVAAADRAALLADGLAASRVATNTGAFCATRSPAAQHRRGFPGAGGTCPPPRIRSPHSITVCARATHRSQPEAARCNRSEGAGMGAPGRDPHTPILGSAGDSGLRR